MSILIGIACILVIIYVLSQIGDLIFGLLFWSVAICLVLGVIGFGVLWFYYVGFDQISPYIGGIILCLIIVGGIWHIVPPIWEDRKDVGGCIFLSSILSGFAFMIFFGIGLVFNLDIFMWISLFFIGLSGVLLFVALPIYFFIDDIKEKKQKRINKSN
jgi:hypothetical protein